MSQLTGAELLDEAQWLLDGGVIPEVVADTLGRTCATLSRLAYRHNRPALATKFGSVVTWNRYGKATTKTAA